VSGVVQAQVDERAELDLAGGLRSMLRQDPEVILFGEIRDRQTAEGTIEASLTGHLVISTFHAGSAATAVSRLSDMGIEPYLLRSGILGILSQRLIRRLCGCAAESENEELRLALPVERFFTPRGCEQCGGIGYNGRVLVSELLLPEPTGLGRANLSRSDAAQLEQLAIQSGMVTCWQRAVDLVSTGQTTPEEVRRVFGFTGSS